ncbi:thioesterase family protein [Xinfangfangia sp. CPCC 101601]|uniref:Thioesterase family protein n=1 Tax=Pseudogemmobacter lacusdianii TaxID=3069608 RepID=A0ABU0W1J8_9RHOB|nr:thioesterase family protein [Xinfangfangia sp. CPCC 101601]MDQ2067844.1 thioesterase family protein [Xinfangfangia sp. CPCC 101601]
MIFRQPIRIEFNHCDPAGIVFYPRYFEMTNSVCQSFCREIIGHSYAEMMARGQGLPAANIAVNFHLPSRLEEVLDWRMQVTRLGGSSLACRLEAHCDGTHRLTADLTLVFVADGRPYPWPQELRDRITAFMEAPDEP